jgi:uncharacterized RDD family membrane protein YckC
MSYRIIAAQMEMNRRKEGNNKKSKQISLSVAERAFLCCSSFMIAVFSAIFAFVYFTIGRVNIATGFFIIAIISAIVAVYYYFFDWEES